MPKLITICSLFLLVSATALGQEALVSFDRIYPDELHVQAFRLDRDQAIQIDAAGLYLDDGSEDRLFMGYCWILNAQSRQVVWAFEPAEFGNDRPEATQHSQTVNLPQGTYVAYYTSFVYFDREDRWNYSYNNWNRGFLGRLFDRIFDRDDHFKHSYRDELMRDFFLTVRGAGQTLSHNELEEMQDAIHRKALLSLPANRDELYLRQGFVLAQPMALDIYAIGELRRRENFDYSFIMNVETREKVWILESENTEHAGGASKNRKARQAMTLPAGKYLAVVTTDGSHSPREWNAPPPHDPAFWGLTILAQNQAQGRYFSTYDYEDEVSKNAIVAFTRLRDDAFESKGFTLNKSMALRIYAIGEGSDGEMYDYGWIVDAKTHEKVWEMDYYDSEHAGGGEKNRLIDTVVNFEKGSYLAYFITDGSHSFRDWNTSPPYDREKWGMTVAPVSQNFNPADISDYVEKDDPDVLAKLVQMRDNVHRSESFTLQKDAEVLVYALGEGSDGRMYDYGWIEHAESGEVVWEMTYRQSDHAGGARKNRMQRAVVKLQAGEYRVYYQSDGSHSFRDWNASPPHDPVNWGVTVSLAR